MTNFYEKGDKPLEIVSTRQWYIKNGGRDTELRDELVARGSELWDKLTPFDLRPQGQDIIRTWLFSTLLRSMFEDGRAPRAPRGSRSGRGRRGRRARCG